MKKALLTIFLLVLLRPVFAQNELQGKELYHYLFPTFTEGTVRQKSGEVNNALLNYNTITQEMIFDQNGQNLALDKTENIDTVYIQNRKFIPAEGVFYEMATNTPVALFIQFKTEMIPPGNNTGFGTSQTAAITNMTDLKASGLPYKLKLPDDYKLVSKNTYWLKKNNNYYVVKTEKNFEELFPSKAEEIKKICKSQ